MSLRLDINWDRLPLVDVQKPTQRDPEDVMSRALVNGENDFVISFSDALSDIPFDVEDDLEIVVDGWIQLEDAAIKRRHWGMTLDSNFLMLDGEFQGEEIVVRLRPRREIGGATTNTMPIVKYVGLWRAGIVSLFAKLDTG